MFSKVILLSREDFLTQPICATRSFAPESPCIVAAFTNKKIPGMHCCLMLCNDWTKYLSWLLVQYSWIPKTL